MHAFKLAMAVCALVVFGALPLAAAQPAPQNVEDGLAAEMARRESALLNAVKNAYIPPQSGLMPHPEDVPMSGSWEDPDWDTPLMQGIYKNPYSYGNNLDNYLPCLKEAVLGNPKAMLALSMYYYLWGYVLEEQYPDFPPEAHSMYFWRAWAVRVTNPGWVSLRLGDLHGRWPASSLEYYRLAAELGNSEAMYNYYKIAGKRGDYLYRSAALGYAKAAFLLSEELEKQGGEDNTLLARRYTWLAALNADEWGLLHSSFSFYNGDFASPGGTPASACEQGYLYAVLSMRYQHGNTFSSQNPDNICMLSQNVISRLEAAADRWQADYDQRRLPYVLRGRYKSAPAIEAVQAELAPLMNKLAITRADAVSGFSVHPLQSRVTQGFSIPWHLGFFNESGPSSHSGLPPTNNNNEFIPLVYAFVILSMLFGAGLMFYSQRQKQKKKQKYRAAPPC